MINEFREEYQFLSNFYLHPINYKGHLFPSSEHAYQYMKCETSLDWLLMCTNFTNSPGKIKRKAKEIQIRKDWEEIKIGVMEEILKIKFSDKFLKEKLLSTNPHKIIEGNFHNDTFWGVCLKTNKGKNHLGIILMSIRFELEFE